MTYPKEMAEGTSPATNIVIDSVLRSGHCDLKVEYIG